MQEHHGLESLVQELIKQNKREEVIDILSRILTNVCSIIDPDLFVIDSQYLKSKDINKIKKGMGQYISKENIPQILITELKLDVYHMGLFALCKYNMPKTILSSTSSGQA